MDHVVYVDAKAKELAEILKGNKRMIIRGATGRKMPYGRVNKGDMLYLIENDGSGLVRAKAKVLSVFNSEKMTKEESISLVKEYQDKLATDEFTKQEMGGETLSCTYRDRGSRSGGAFHH